MAVLCRRRRLRRYAHALDEVVHSGASQIASLCAAARLHSSARPIFCAQRVEGASAARRVLPLPLDSHPYYFDGPAYTNNRETSG